MSDRKIGPSVIVAAVPDIEPLAVRLPVATQLTGLDETQMRELVASGEIEVFKVGRTELVHYPSLKSFIAKAISLMIRRPRNGDADGNVIWLTGHNSEGDQK